ncbi:hypothetical protein NC651_031075 [Populus alba x Populus x berolinensis]|nr:hypothetical protein NC651_031075 [Populus alba x Populus x berolinensis]
MDNTQESSSSPSTDVDDKLFDLPDLFIDGVNHSDGFCYYSPPWQLCSADTGFRLEEPFFMGAWHLANPRRCKVTSELRFFKAVLSTAVLDTPVIIRAVLGFTI